MNKRAPKAYRNLEFINSPDARTIRILAEFYEPKARFRKNHINNIIVFFGSARSKNNVVKAPGNQLSAYYEKAEEVLVLWKLPTLELKQVMENLSD